MFPPKEIGQNLLMGSSAVQRFAARRHDTGIMSRSDHGERILRTFLEHLPGGLAGRDVLELGPGQGLELARAAIGTAASYAAFDVTSYADPAAFAAIGVDYRVSSTGHMDWPAASFDIVWSYSVLEHIRSPASAIDQVVSLLRPGGFHIAWIDLETHLGGRDDPTRMYEFLRYPEWLWRAMTSNRSTYVNRLRASEWRRLFIDAGLQVEAEYPVRARCELADLRRVSYLSGLSDDDLLTKQTLFVTSLPRAPEPGDPTPPRG